jgi:hypothetical protein
MYNRLVLVKDFTELSRLLNSYVLLIVSAPEGSWPTRDVAGNYTRLVNARVVVDIGRRTICISVRFAGLVSPAPEDS